ncbi:MAG TPA: hypothetical protein VJO12_05780 [Stellaceae bacterium]|nr:hypothetical protein [Stellaceae bacterium]
MSEFRVTRKPVPSPVQRAWLRRGLDQPGGKLPLFDDYGKQIDPRTVQACLEQGWAEPWFANPTKRDWLVCKLTAAGRQAARKPPVRPVQLDVVPEVEKTTV